MSIAPAIADHSPLRTARAGLEQAVDAVLRRLASVAEGTTLPPFEAPMDSALVTLRHIFGLDAAALECLTLAAANEVDGRIESALAALDGTGRCDVAAAVHLIGPDVWDALCPDAPLRHWRLIELQGTGPLRQRLIHLDERVLQALLGTTHLDQRLDGLVTRLEPVVGTVARVERIGARIAAAWAGAEGRLPLVCLTGSDAATRRLAAGTAAQVLGLPLLRLAGRDIPSDAGELALLTRILDRELALSGAAVLIEAGAEDEGDAAQRLADRLTGPTVLAGPDPGQPERQPHLRLDLPACDRCERREAWRQALGAHASTLADDLDRITTQFALDGEQIAAAAAMATAQAAPSRSELAGALWDAARTQSRRSLEGLAERIESRARWDDLVLPAECLATLNDLAGHQRHAWRVQEDWGWAAASPRGLGAAALFAGPSGTGKTLAAEVLAGELGLDLYRIDLSQVVSKYIGETEKNLARIFAAAEDGGAILLFDEADALFGKRTDVKDSHDRYANVEVSYLLQRMEAHQGLAILTTNFKSALDTAFLRRLRYVVSFPFPDAPARAAIWARVFPAATPLDGVDPEALARLAVTGGTIRSIALNAVYAAADGGGPVRPEHLLRAARREYAKIEKPLTAAETRAFA